MSVSPNGNFLATADHDNHVHLYNLSKYQVRVILLNMIEGCLIVTNNLLKHQIILKHHTSFNAVKHFGEIFSIILIRGEPLFLGEEYVQEYIFNSFTFFLCQLFSLIINDMFSIIFICT